MDKLLIVCVLLLQSCIAVSQEDLNFLDYTEARDMPSFVLTDMRDRSEFRSSDHDDAAFVIEFYFAHCPACNQNADNVNRLVEEFKGNPKVQILELSIDCDDRLYQEWISDHDPKNPVLNGCNADIVNTLNVSRFPTTYVFAPNKRQAMYGIGVWSNSMYNQIKRYLDQVK